MKARSWIKSHYTVGIVSLGIVTVILLGCSSDGGHSSPVVHSITAVPTYNKPVTATPVAPAPVVMAAPAFAPGAPVPPPPANFRMVASAPAEIEKMDAPPAPVTPTFAADEPATNLVDVAPGTKISAQPLNASPQLEEIVRLANSGVEEAVLLGYVESSPVAYDLAVDDILYLNDIGVSAKVITALIEHGKALRAQAGMPAPAANPPTANPAAAIYTGPPAQNMAPMAVEQPPQPVAMEAPASMPAQASVFYQELSPYGNWIYLEDYGWTWQPTVMVVNRDWRPYSQQGQWIYSDAGWYWQSDYSWGWAPFHYGRWHNHFRHGWVWAPDTVWGPAWVSWRSSDTYCGWAPLPPGAYWDVGIGLTFHHARVGLDFDFGLAHGYYNFVPWRNFTDHRIHSRILPDREASVIYNRTTVINNYVNNPRNNTVVNYGAGTERVTAFRTGKLEQVSVRDLPPSQNRLVRPDRVEKAGATSVIYRPRLVQDTTPSGAGLASGRGDGARKGTPQRVLSGNATVVGGSERSTSAPSARAPQNDTYRWAVPPTPVRNTAASPVGRPGTARDGSVGRSAPNTPAVLVPNSGISAPGRTGAAVNRPASVSSPATPPGATVATPRPAPGAPSRTVVTRESEKSTIALPPVRSPASPPVSVAPSRPAVQSTPPAPSRPVAPGRDNRGSTLELPPVPPVESRIIKPAPTVSRPEPTFSNRPPPTKSGAVSAPTPMTAPRTSPNSGDSPIPRTTVAPRVQTVSPQPAVRIQQPSVAPRARTIETRESPVSRPIYVSPSAAPAPRYTPAPSAPVYSAPPRSAPSVRVESVPMSAPPTRIQPSAPSPSPAVRSSPPSKSDDNNKPRR